MGGQTEFKADYSYRSRELKLESFLLDFAGFDTVRFAEKISRNNVPVDLLREKNIVSAEK